VSQELPLSLQPQKLVRRLSCINNRKELKVYGIMFVTTFVKIGQNLKIEMDTCSRTWTDVFSLA